MSRILPWLMLLVMGMGSMALAQDAAAPVQNNEANEQNTAAAAESAPKEFANLPQDGAWAKSKTAKDPEVETDRLEAMLVPLTQEELKAELEAWQALVKFKAQERADKKIEVMELEAGEARKAANSRAVELGTVVDDLADRMQVALKAYREAGGDVAVFEKYLAKVSSSGIPDLGASDNVFDIGTALYEWLILPSGGIKWGLRILSFIGILLAFKILAAILAGVVKRATHRVKQGSDLMRQFFVNMTRRLIFIIGIVIAVSQLGVDVGPLLAAIGAAGFIIGFALQGTLSNFAAGIMILMYQPFDVGDAVEVAGVSGAVEKMTLVSTTIKSWDNKQIVVPNNSIWGDVITNITGNAIRRVDMVFGIGYDDDIEKAQSVLESIIADHEKVLKDPEPTIKLHELGDSSVNFVVRPWARKEDYWGLYWDITKEVKRRFDKEGISIPFPQRDVHIYQENAQA
jgi:small conductance mechanosensitive channel